MRIAVLVKEVPDTYSERVLREDTGLTDRQHSEAVLDEIGERALELALRYADRVPDTEVILVSMGPAGAETSLRRGLAMGATSVVHIADERLDGADLRLTAEVLAAAIRSAEVDLVVAGNRSTDGAGGVIPAMLAELLQLPALTSLVSVEIAPTRVDGVRQIEGGTAVVGAELPAIVSVVESLPDPRFPGLKGIMAAKRKPYRVVGLDELGIDPGHPDEPRSIVIAASRKPARGAGTKVVDEGDGGSRIADFLIENRLV